ncbi:MAG TPA: hypothetical protein PLD88_10045, partial [Candidatus Berkiella sp.]|nr:hypothetical protein [Candidatus Berkiella sp.]
YALGVFKKLGIFEAKSLSNAFFQITRTKKSKMQQVDNTNLTCPLKDDFINQFNDYAKVLNDILPQIKQSNNIQSLQNAVEDL